MDRLPRITLTPIEQGSRPSQPYRNSTAPEAPQDGTQKNWRSVLESSVGTVRRQGERVRHFSAKVKGRIPVASRRSRTKQERSPRERKNREKEAVPFITTLQGQVAVCVGVILLALALKAVDTPATQSVSAQVDEVLTTQTDLDQSLGKLQFVQNIFSDSTAVFWQQKAPEKLQPPFDGKVTSRYSIASPGIEISGKKQEVYTCHEGKVLDVQSDETGMTTVTIQHTGGLVTVYGNLENATVKKGDKLKTGEQIALAQPDGGAYSMFLQVKLDDVVVDPLPYFQ